MFAALLALAAPCPPGDHGDPDRMTLAAQFDAFGIGTPDMTTGARAILAIERFGGVAALAAEGRERRARGAHE